MPVTYVDSASIQSSAGFNGNPTISIPATTQDGDLLIAICFYTDVPTDETFISWPSGWTNLETAYNFNNVQIAIAHTIKGPGTTDPTWGLTNPPLDTTWNKTIVAIIAYRGAASTPVMGTKFTETSSTATLDAPGISGVTGDVALGVYSARSSSFTTIGVTPAPQQTQRLHHLYSGGGGASIALADETFTSNSVPTRNGANEAVSSDKIGFHINIPTLTAPPAPGEWTSKKFVRFG